MSTPPTLDDKLMRKAKVMMVVGARPQFIKSAPIIRELVKSRKQIKLSIVHTGQHYDREMSHIFFHELKIPKPIMNLAVGSGSHAIQTATMMKRLEQSMLTLKPDLVVVPGDTNTTLAGAIVAAKLGIQVFHVEAGLRSGDMSMPEEVNRTLTDHCSTMLFAPTRNAVQNLRQEGLGEKTYLTGDTMVDALFAVMPIIRQRTSAVLKRFELCPREYLLMTLHRPSNVDNSSRLREILAAVRRIARKLKVVFPAHPRTRASLARLGSSAISSGRVVISNPLGYVENLCLLKNASCLLTDSGGMQKESFLLHVPCTTLRSSTEWPETLVKKANQLVCDPKMISETVLAVAFDERLRNKIRDLRNPFGDGRASIRIVQLIRESVETQK
jgi:UDP-N-acetylglucosamine 2-epimerase (non-hydrolysing)